MSNYKEQIDKFLKENDMSQIQIELWLNDRGYVVVSQEVYDNMEVINPDGPCP